MSAIAFVVSIALRNLQLQQRHPLQSSWVSFAIFRSAKDGLRYGLHVCGTDGVRQGRDCRIHRLFHDGHGFGWK